MKARNILFLLLIVPMGMISCDKDSSPLERSNPYDSKSDGSQNKFVVRHEIVSESMVSDGLLQNNEDMYIKIFVSNAGAKAALVNKLVITNPPGAQYSFYPLGLGSQVLTETEFVKVGTFKVTDYIEPGYEIFLDSEKDAPNGKDYTVRIRRSNTSTAPSHQILVSLIHDRGGEYYFKHEFSIVIPSN